MARTKQTKRKSKKTEEGAGAGKASRVQLKTAASLKPRFLLDGIALLGIKSNNIKKLGEVASFRNVPSDVLEKMTGNAIIFMLANLKKTLQSIIQRKVSEQSTEVGSEDVQSFLRSLPEERRSLPPLPVHSTTRLRPLNRAAMQQNQLQRDVTILIAAIVTEMAAESDFLRGVISARGGDASASVTISKDGWGLLTEMASLCVVWYFYDNLVETYNTEMALADEINSEITTRKRDREESDSGLADKRARAEETPQLLSLWPKALTRLAKVASFNVPGHVINSFHEEAEMFARFKLRNILDRALLLTRHSNRGTLTATDVEYVMEGLDEPAELPPLPSNATQRLRSLERSALSTVKFKRDLSAIVSFITNEVSAAGDAKPGRPVVVQRSASKLLNDYLCLRIVWFYYDKFILVEKYNSVPKYLAQEELSGEDDEVDCIDDKDPLDDSVSNGQPSTLTSEGYAGYPYSGYQVPERMDDAEIKTLTESL